MSHVKHESSEHEKERGAERAGGRAEMLATCELELKLCEEGITAHKARQLLGIALHMPAIKSRRRPRCCV